MRPKYRYRRRKAENEALLHRQIAEKALGRPLPKTVVVHHHDGDGENNENTNLVICENQKYHQLLHRRQRVLNAGGDPYTQKLCCNSDCRALISVTWRSGYCQNCQTAISKAYKAIPVPSARTGAVIGQNPKRLIPDLTGVKWWGRNASAVDDTETDANIAGYSVPAAPLISLPVPISQLLPSDEYIASRFWGWRPRSRRSDSYLQQVDQRKAAAILLDIIIGLELIA